VIVPVEGEVLAPVRVAPSSILLGVVAPGSLIERNIITHCQTPDHEVDALSVQDSNWELVHWEKQRVNSRDAKILLRVKTPVSAGYKSTYMLLHEANKANAVKVLLTCFVSEKAPVVRK